MRSGIIKILAFFLIQYYGSLSAQSQNLYILFTANISGAIENCNCGSNPLGGADRLKFFIDKFKKEHPGTILIDGGDFFNSYPYPELNRAMLKVLSLINYDVIVPGEHEFTANASIISQYLTQNSERLMVSNRNINNFSFRKFRVDRIEVVVYSILDPDVFSLIKQPDTLHLSPKFSLTRRHESSNHFNILVYHGKSDGLQKILEKSRWIDLVLLAHDQLKGQTIIAGKTVVGVGRDAESVAIINVHHKADLISAQVEFKSIDLKIPADEQVANIIREYKMAIRPQEKYD